MEEFIRFILLSNGTLLLFWCSYMFVFRGNTFHGLNRAYLLAGSVVALLVPLLPIPTNASASFIGLQLPAITIGNSSAYIGQLQATSNLFYMIYALGSLIALWLFIRSINKLVHVLACATPEIVQGELVFRSENTEPFSFLTIIHIPRKLNAAHVPTVLQHEIAHVRLGHSYDVLWLNFLRILFWFNPLLSYYLRSLQEVHEYQADTQTHAASSKEAYVQVQLNQFFGLDQPLSFTNNFSNSINLKKRIAMIYTKKTSKWAALRYVVAAPLTVIVLLASACTDIPSQPTVPATEKNKVYDQNVDVMPEYKGGTQNMIQYLIEHIQYPEAALQENITGKVFVQFVVNTKGGIEQVEVVKGVRDDLDAEAVRVVSNMPNWTPGSHQGKHVNVKMVLPISYQL